jgi:hypothetical protein
MHDALDKLIDAFENLLPRIVGEHGHGWVVFAGPELVNRFADFPEAAKFAQDHYDKCPVLIRHTDEAALTAPFVHIRG